MAETKTSAATATPVRQPLKVEKEKTMASVHSSEQATINTTQPLSNENLTRIAQSRQNDGTSTPPMGKSLSNYSPGMYQNHAIGNGLTTAAKLHAVKNGESIEDIAKKHGVSKEALIKANLSKINVNEKGEQCFTTYSFVAIPAKAVEVGDKETNTQESAAVNESTEPGLSAAPASVCPAAAINSGTSNSTATAPTTSPVTHTGEIINLDKGKESENSEVSIEKAKDKGDRVPGVWISSVVGLKASSPKQIANLAEDVLFVQSNLVRLEIMSDEDALSEKVLGVDVVSSDKIPKTIAALFRFQKDVCGYGGDGYATPGGGTIKNLVGLTLEQKEVKTIAISSKREKIKKAEQFKKLMNSYPAEVQELEINRAKYDKNEQLKPREKTDKELALEIIQKGKDFYNIMGSVLAKYIFTRPKIITYALDLIGYSKEDDLALHLSKSLSDDELKVIDINILIDIKDRIDDITMYAPGKEFTSDFWEVRRLAKVIKARGQSKQKIVTEKKSTSKKQKTSYSFGNINEDKEFLKKAFVYNSKLEGDVGKGKANNSDDVKKVALRLEELGFTKIPIECKNEGTWNDKLHAIIKDYQTKGKGDGYYARRIYEGKYKANKPNGIVGTNDATFKALFINTGLSSLYMNRATVNSKISTGKTSLSGTVGKGKTNTAADVMLVAELLVEYGIENVPEICLKDGTWDDGLVLSLNAFEAKAKLKKAGWINHKGNNIKVLSAKRNGQPLKVMGYNMNEQEHSPGENRDEYNEKLDKIEKNMGVEKDGELGKILSIANKAATAPQYFQELTSGISEKLTNIEKWKKDEDVTLSLVLVDRMKRFHKFLVATGLYSGNMSVSDGARSQKRAHRWCVEYVVESSKAPQSYKNAVKTNLIDMYGKEKYRDGEFVVDSDKNKWAKKVHFYTYYGSNPNYKTKAEYDVAQKNSKKKEETGEQKTGLFWNDLVTYIKNYTTAQKEEYNSAFRGNSSEAASEGYASLAKRLPNKSGSRPSISNHCDGGAMDISSSGFLMKTEAMIDLIGLRFGLIRDGGEGESWHFEMTGVEVTKENEKYLKEN